MVIIIIIQVNVWHMDLKKTLCESDLDRVINFVLGIVCANQQTTERTDCPHCGGSYILKNGHKDGRQRFFCKDCKHTFTYTTNTLMENSHYGRSI